MRQARQVRQRRRLLRAAGCLGCLLWATAAQASLPEIAGLGTRSPALAGTGTAYLSGFESVYTNPAGLLGPQRHLTLGAIYGGYLLKLDSTSHRVADTSGLLIGASLPLPLGGAARDRVALGLGFYLPFGVVNRANDPYPDVPRAALLDNRTQVVSVMVGAAALLGRGFSVGGGVLALAALVGEIFIAPDQAGRISAISQEQLTVDFAPILGARWQAPRHPVALGLVFRGASQSSYNIVVKSHLAGVVPIDLPTITISGVAQYDPLQVGAEAAWAPLRSRSLMLAAQLTWKHWSAYQQPVMQATTGAPPLPAPGFHDTVVPRIAAEWLPPRTAGLLRVRLGYFFEWSPAPSDQQATLLDSDRHVLCGGLAYKLPGRLPLTLETYLQWHQLAPGRLSGGFAMGGTSLGVDL